VVTGPREGGDVTGSLLAESTVLDDSLMNTCYGDTLS